LRWQSSRPRGTLWSAVRIIQCKRAILPRPFAQIQVKFEMAARTLKRGCTMSGKEPVSQHVRQLLEQARQGSDQALAELFTSCSDYILKIVRYHLHWPLHQKCDSFDVLQEVGLALWGRPVPESALESRQAFLGYLLGLAKHKLAEERRHYARKQRSLEREAPIEKSAAEEMPARDPDPAVTGAEHDEWERYLRGLSPVERAIVRRLRAGYHQGEIAIALHMSERTVGRLLHGLKLPAETP
jgi:RNA polymerase sigma factor (sigma-70 family)